MAAAEGHYDIVDFLVNRAKVPINPSDRYDYIAYSNSATIMTLFYCFRWSRTPLDEAKTFGHNKVADLLRLNSARHGRMDHEACR